MNMLEGQNDLLIYKDKDGNIVVDAIYRDETLWLTQKGMAKVFDVDRTVITKHLKNIFTDGELNKNSVCAKFAHTAEDGKTYKTDFYNLDAIIAVGYRVNSKKATEFRIWATKVLKEYIIKGFALNDERFIRGNKYDAKYFDELLERIKTIRVSGRMSKVQTKKLRICSLQLLQIIILNQKKLIHFLKLFKTNFIMLSLVILQQNLFIIERMLIKNIWVSLIGKIPLMD